MGKHSEEDTKMLAEWPTVTDEDIKRGNGLFEPYVFSRPCPKKDALELWTSCCGQHKQYPYLQRTETQTHRDFMEAKHNDPVVCPYCGHAATLKDLRRAGKRKSLCSHQYVMLLHAKEDALYGDALCLKKDYPTMASLTAPPTAWCSSGYRFSMGDVAQVDHQVYSDVFISHEREKLGCKKLVQEPFKNGSISWYLHENYSIINREALTEHPKFKYCQFFGSWQYKPGGGRGYSKLFNDFVSYLTAYCIYPRQIEMLCKVGLFQPVCALVNYRKKFAAAIKWEVPDIRKAMGLSKSELNYVISVQPPMEVLEVRNYVQRHWGKQWPISFCYDFWNLWGCHLEAMVVLRFLRHHKLEPLRFIKYLDDQTIQDINTYYADAFVLYRDYLEAAYLLGRCMEHGKVLWPDSLVAAHDEATMALDAVHAKDAMKGVAIEGKARKEKYEFELDGLRIVFPLTGASIKREGKALSHCVGGYADRHMKGVVTILFLRKSESPGTPYITVEMSGNQIVQVHGYKNDLNQSVRPRAAHKSFFDTWLKWLRAGSRRDEAGNPLVPKRRKERVA